MSQLPVPQSVHVGRTFTAPHNEIYLAMQRFVRDMERAEQAYRVEVVTIREKLNVDAQYAETPDVERYSLVIQIFAAMTIEAAISFYAVLRFGGQHHDEYFRWDAAHKRLTKALAHVGITLAADAEVTQLIESRMRARHRIVHPFSAEYLGDEAASIQVPERLWPDGSAAAARLAIKEVHRFCELLRELDAEHGHFFYLG